MVLQELYGLLSFTRTLHIASTTATRPSGPKTPSPGTTGHPKSASTHQPPNLTALSYTHTFLT